MNKVQDLEVKNPKKLIYGVIVAQLILTVIVAGIVWPVMNLQAAYSALIAGVICAVANWYFTWRVFRHQGARAAKQFLIAYCFGEVMKLLLLGALFVVAVLHLRIVFGPFLISFIINLMIYWLAPFVIFGFLESNN